MVMATPRTWLHELDKLKVRLRNMFAEIMSGDEATRLHTARSAYLHSLNYVNSPVKIRE